jgi:hypothetical protein
VSRAESIALAFVLALASGVIVPYAFDAAGFGIMPLATVGVSLASAVAVFLLSTRSANARADGAVVAVTVALTFAVLLWVARPELLPPGSGPDLTHHLLLVDYIQQHGTLVHDPNAVAAIGEMAYYTPGVHVLAVLGGSLFRVDPFVILYPLAAFTIALKFGVFALCLLRLTRPHQSRAWLATCGIALLFVASVYTIGSVVNDSFLAQAVAELFALTMWWAVIAWDEQPARWPLIVFAVSGAATFLTWPIWIGPPLLALALVVMVRTDIEPGRRLADFGAASIPVAVVAAVHLLGRTAGLGLASTSGAMSAPGVDELGWWLPLLAIAALLPASRTAGSRPLLALVAALAAQSIALWLVARQRGAPTPYMALKMMYLAVYPLVAALIVGICARARSRAWNAAIVAAMVILAARHLALAPRPQPTVSRDLWRAGLWVRAQAPPGCVDYLVGNEYTAYWLHLAVLRNPRSAARSTDNRTYETQASVARWLVDDGGARYAIARMAVVPREISDRARVLYRSGDAAVLSRPGECGTTPRGG